MVQLFTYKQIKCNKNKILVRYIDKLTIEKVHDIKEISKDRPIFIIFLFILRMIS